MAISEFYRSIRAKVGTTLLLVPAVAAVIRDREGRVLLQQSHDRSWSLPSGAIEPGERPSQAVIREALEETGLQVRPERVRAILGGAACRVRYAHGDEVEYVVTVFECSVLGGSLIDGSDETRALAYFRVDEMPALSFPYPKHIFEHSGGEPFFESASHEAKE